MQEGGGGGLSRSGLWNERLEFYRGQVGPCRGHVTLILTRPTERPSRWCSRTPRKSHFNQAVHTLLPRFYSHGDSSSSPGAALSLWETLRPPSLILSPLSCGTWCRLSVDSRPESPASAPARPSPEWTRLQRLSGKKCPLDNQIHKHINQMLIHRLKWWKHYRNEAPSNWFRDRTTNMIVLIQWNHFYWCTVLVLFKYFRMD